jgi:hypothetical protein
MSLMLIARELAAHWRTYHKALENNEPGAFSWVAFGYRIVDTATWLRDQMGYEPDEPCHDLVALSGAMHYGGLRGKRERLPTSIFKRGYAAPESIPEPWDIDVFATRPKRKKAKWFKKPRAVVEGNVVLVLHKGRRTLFKVCVTEEGAALLSARINQKELPGSELEVTDAEEENETDAPAGSD